MPANSNLPIKNIFISYRVQDSSGQTFRLVDSLKETFEEKQIFIDIEKLEPGIDFTEAINRSLRECHVLLAVIGPEWCGKPNSDGVTRINLSDDWVRLELETAFKRNIRVVPLLVDGARLPKEEELPTSLHSLVKRQAVELSNTRWKYDTYQLKKFLVNTMGIAPKAEDKKPVRNNKNIIKYIAIAVAVFFVLGIIGVIMEEAEKEKNKENTIVSPPSNSNNQTEPNVYNTPANPPANEEVVSVENIAGTWYDAGNAVYIYITQTGADLQISDENQSGQNTANGTGRVNGNKITMQLHSNVFGQMTGTGIIANGGHAISGNIFVSVDGGISPRPFNWVRENGKVD